MPHKTQVIEKKGDVSIIYTAKGEAIYVDNEDVPKLSAYSWCLNKAGYPVARIDGRVVRIHRYLLGPSEGEIIDHINGNPLDNRKSNLRKCNNTQNARNCKLGKNNKTGYTGVSLTPEGKYKARIMADRREIRLGHYLAKDAAIVARMSAERDFFDSFAPVDNALRNSPCSEFLEKGMYKGMLYCGKKQLRFQTSLSRDNYKTLERKPGVKTSQSLLDDNQNMFQTAVAAAAKKEAGARNWKIPMEDMPVSVKIKFLREIPRSKIQWVKAAAQDGLTAPPLPENWSSLSDWVMATLVGIVISTKSQVFDISLAAEYAEQPRTEVTVTGYYLNLGEIKATANANIKRKKEIEKHEAQRKQR